MCISFSEYVNYMTESKLDIFTDKLVWISDKNVDYSTGIKTNFGKGKLFSPYVKKIIAGYGDVINSYSMYLASSDNSTEVLKKIKTADFNDATFKNFMSRSGIFGAKIFKEIGGDILVTPKSSSLLNIELAKQISAKTKAPVMESAFIKNSNVFNIGINYDDPRLSEKVAKGLESILKRAQREGYLKMVQVLPQNRKFLTNVFQLVDDNTLDKFYGKHVVIVDDVMTSGATIQSIYSLISSGAKQVSVITMFKSQK